MAGHEGDGAEATTEAAAKKGAGGIVLGIARTADDDPKTLRKHYRDELDTGATKATAKVAEFLFRKATTEGRQCVTAVILWMKTRGGGGKRRRPTGSR